MARSIRVIPATISMYSQTPLMELKKRRVAAYARVSTDREDQTNSYEAQVSYYTDYIKGRDDWEFVAVYADEGISGCATKGRKGFNSMIADALAGKIDLIITKSVSRFARNTVDSLTTIRKLKDKGIEVYFEKEQIWTLDGKGELLISIMSSLAQEESRSISENVTWGHRKRFADGKAMVPFGRFLGFEKGEDGKMVVNQEQAVIVKLIYKLYLEGHSCYKIANILTEKGIPSPGGKAKWNGSCVESILTNEKYKGDALLQKVYTVNYLTKEKRKNTGKVPQFYVTEHHEAIIDPKIFEQVQAEMVRRKNNNGRYSGVGTFASKIKCGECGNWYGSKVWHSNDKYKGRIFQCNHKYKSEKVCTTPHLTEEEIKEIFVKAVNQYLSEKSILLTNADEICRIAGDTASLEARCDALTAEMNALLEQTENLITENASVAMDQTVYAERYGKLVGEYKAKNAEFDQLQSEIADKKAREVQIQNFIRRVRELDTFVTEFDKGLWSDTVEYMTVYSKEKVVVTFKDGTEI